MQSAAGYIVDLPLRLVCIRSWAVHVHNILIGVMTHVIAK